MKVLTSNRTFLTKKTNSSIIFHILVIFIITRLFLAVVGTLAAKYYQSKNPNSYIWHYSKQTYLDIWSVWDSGWYLDVAKNGYSPVANKDSLKISCCGQSNLVFFPLYPLSISLLNKILGDYPISGIVASNIFLLAAAIVFYKLVLLDESHNTAIKSVRYLFFYPVSFIFSSIFPESLFLLLLLSCFYFAKKNRWLISGILGFLLSLTKSTGIFVAIPLLFLYLQQRSFKIKNIKPNILYILFFPLGISTFLYYTYLITGNFWSVFIIERQAWWHRLSNPIQILLLPFLKNNINNKFLSLYSIIEMAIVVFFAKKINRTYIILSLILFFMPLFSGGLALPAMPRFTMVIFPIYIILAKVIKDRKTEIITSFFLFAFQAILMALWSNGLSIY